MAKKIRLYHATKITNVPSIQEKGLLPQFGEVYLTDSLESASRWMGFRFKASGEQYMSIVEVEVDPSKLIEGTDHSPMMVQLFGVGKSLVSPKRIPKSAIKKIHYYQLNPEHGTGVEK